MGIPFFERSVMIEKKQVSIPFLMMLLVPILIVSYYISGIFTFPDMTILNATDYLPLIFEQWYKVWWNEKTPACLGVGIILWVFLCWYILYHYRNFQAGHEYGDEEWADPYDITKRRSNPDPNKNRILSQNVRVATEGENAPSNNNMMLWGSSGQYKSTSIVMRNVLESITNCIVLDVKGELLYKCGLKLKNDGYTIRVLNLKDPELSDRYNPFAYIEKEEDLIKLIANIQQSLTPPDSMSNDPFWQQGVALYLQSTFYYEWFIAKEEGRTATFNNVLKLINDETKYDTSVKVEEGEKPPTILQMKMNAISEKYGEDNPAVRDYRKLKEGATETVRSIIIITNAMLKLCETKALQRVFEADDMNLREFATGVGGTVEHPTKNKIALFIVTDDNDSSYNFVASMLYSQALQILCRMADYDFKEQGGKLPIPLVFWMDEYYAGARPAEAEKLMGTIRSRNMSLIPILQSKSQVEALYKSNKWEIMMDNCATIVFLGCGAGALSTQKYISELLGKMTIDTFNDGKNGNNYSGNYNKTGKELLTPAGVRKMSRKNCIIFLEGEFPIIDRKAFPWETGASRSTILFAKFRRIFNKNVVIPYSAYQIAMQLNKESPDGGYVCAVRGMLNTKTGAYETVITEPKVEEVAEIPAGAKKIIIDENFLYKDYTQPCEKVDDDQKMMIAFLREKEYEQKLDKLAHPDKEQSVTLKKDMQLPLVEYINQYICELDDSRKQQICEAIALKIPEQQIKEMFDMSLKDMIKVTGKAG